MRRSESPQTKERPPIRLRAKAVIKAMVEDFVDGAKLSMDPMNETLAQPKEPPEAPKDQHP